MKINITGYTAAQNNTKSSNRKKLVGLSQLLPEILEDSGHTVGYNLEDADLNIIFIYALNSLNTSYALKSLELIKTKKCIIAFDDWNIKVVYYFNDRLLNGFKMKSHPVYTSEQIDQYLGVLKDINEGKYKVLFPAYKLGDHELLEIKGEKHFIDPSIYIKKTVTSCMFPELKPVHASLANKESWLKKNIKYDYLNLKNITEEEVFDKYSCHRIVIVPPHYHNKSGWWRNRYTLANLANAVVVEDKDSIFGPHFEIKGDEVNESNIDDLFNLQNIAYQETIQSKEEIKNSIKELLK